VTSLVIVICTVCGREVPETLYCLNCGEPILALPRKTPEPMKPLEPMCIHGVPMSKQAGDPRCMINCCHHLAVLAEEDPTAENDYYICSMGWPE